MKLVIPGGSGQVGAILARHFCQAGHEVVILSRGAPPASDQTVSQYPNLRFVAWDARTLGPWAAELDGADAVINLAGRSVNCRYHAENRRLITESRVQSTQVVGQAIAAAAWPPRVWLQASSATIYAHRFDAPNDEFTGILANEQTDPHDTWQFSIGVVHAWEKALNDAKTPATRKVILRSSMVMSPNRGGVFDVLRRLARLGLGGPVGGGRQFVSWIHDRDFARALEFLMRHHEIAGPVNVAAPNPMPYRDFMRTLRRACGGPIGLPATKWMLEIGTCIMRTESELVLKSRRVVPGRLLQAGFGFEFPVWESAVADLCRRWRERA